ncbi:type III restriction endonuclease subunit R [Rouxiella badensis]|uniref:type III restriction endonuclease subunit R n=1 Tax=Rouxiella badensis TaxID=1646377 RepID=UPI0022AB0874|nr:type III restriction endonuclease subunit R [Rouxiella badensis]WAT08856.1 type III restriction endonuclease subunit R [Rouxiella badensis]
MNNPEYIYPKLRYVSAPCGSGKTTAICEIINNSHKKNILVQNTQELIKITADKITNCKYIITESIMNDESVISAAIEFLESPCTHNLLITDKTFFKIPPEFILGWDVYIDDVVNFHSFKIINEINPNVKDIIINNLIRDVESLDCDEIYITAKRNLRVEGEVISMISNQFSILKENDFFIMNNEYFTKKEKKQLNITAWKDLTVYNKIPITFFGANFENSLIYKGNKRIFESVELEGLLTRKTELKDRLKVFYFSKEITLSKTWKENNSEKVQTIYDYLDSVLEGQEFYWTKNKSDLHSLRSGTEISPDARGFNHYQSFSKCVWMACMRPSEAEAKQCELFFNFSGEDIHIAREYESLHQFVLRGISRDFDSTEKQIVYVFDECQAKYLTDNIEYIDLGIDYKEQGTKGRPLGSKNRKKKFTLHESKATRFRRWKKSNPALRIEDFVVFMKSSINTDLNEDEIDAMYKKYEKAVGNKKK